MCEVCPDEIAPGEPKRYNADGPVHSWCDTKADKVCRKTDCNLVHAGSCW